jgi:ferredoxin
LPAGGKISFGWCTLRALNGGKTMSRIPVVDQTLCISCGLCVELAPNTFALDENDLSHVIDPEGDPEELIQEAIDSCPTEAISWQED